MAKFIIYHDNIELFYCWTPVTSKAPQLFGRYYIRIPSITHLTLQKLGDNMFVDHYREKIAC